MVRRFVPRSLYARVVLIVILPIFLMQSVITYTFFARHWDQVTANLSRTTAGQIALITGLYEANDDAAARAKLFEDARAVLDLAIVHEPGAQIPATNKLSPFNLYNRTFEARLRARLEHPFWFNTKSWPTYVEVRVQLDDGALVFFVLRDRVFATSGPIFLAWLIGTSILLGWIAIAFLRNQVRSILKLAAAAEAFGRGRDMPEFRPSGATEVRRAGRAFIAMRERVRRTMEQRSVMLAGVSHDLKTPLTRMKLTLALKPDEKDLEAMRDDIAEMERMLEAFIDFANDGGPGEEPESLDIGDLVREVAEDADPEGARLVVAAPPGVVVEGRRDALKRAIANLAGNALKYGEHGWINVSPAGARVEIVVDDDGPGIPPERYQDVFKPFFRLDAARGQKIPGVGLGLAVVRDVARAHGGEIVLDRAPQGGLRATLRLPA